MRIALLLCLLGALHLTSIGQKISYDPPPDLGAQISKSDYRLIVDSSVAIIKKNYGIESVKSGAVRLAGNVGTINLDNLILKCLAQEDRKTWPAIISDHFENLFSSIDAQKKLDPGNYASMKKYLSIRIYPRETVEQRGGPDKLVARTDLEGTYTLLMLDLPGAFTAVDRKMFERWKMDEAEVFKAALANVDTQKVEKVTQSFDFQGNKIEVSILGNEDYAASYALDLLNNSPELVGEWGSAIAIPNKGLASLCKISRAKPVDFVNFIQMSQAFIQKSYREHPQPISDQFFWYYKGKFTRILVTTDAKGNINVISPQGLTALMTQPK